MMLNQQSVTRAGGAIWKELPSVDLPKDTFTHLFMQHTTIKEKPAEKAVSIRIIIILGSLVDINPTHYQ